MQPTFASSFSQAQRPLQNFFQNQFAHGSTSNPNFQPLGQHGSAFGGYRQDGEKAPQRKQPEDRPKKKQVILGCKPWILVHTKFKRRFVYNPELGKSFWKFPQDVMMAVIEMDRVEREKQDRRERCEASDVEEQPIEQPLEGEAKATPEPVESEAKAEEFDSDEYEEVEVTDDEDEGPNKRPKLEDDKPQGPLEFDEDDIAYQIAAMGQDETYDDYQDAFEERFEEEPPLSDEDAKALFMDLLDDHRINTYTPWETIVEEGKIIDDDRYTCLPNMKSRKETWDTWSRNKIQKLREQREKEEKKDPKMPYMAFLEKNATPKLYWPEFRRKYNKEAVMRDTKLKDKDRENWYREYIKRLKLPERTLKDDLTNLLKSVPISALNRSTDISALPSALLTDLRYISLRQKIRDPLIESYIALAPPAPNLSDQSPEEEAEAMKRKQERERREKALAEREQRVQEEKRKQRGKLQYSRDMLREEEEEVQRAMRIGREGLLGHFEAEKE